MKVLHAWCMNYNIGDYFLSMGVKNLLRKYFPVDFIADTNIQGQYFTEYYINEVVNKKYDLLVIGGGGLIHGYHWPNGWFWLCDKDLIKTIKIPFIVYGVGNNYWENQDLLPKTIEHLNETIDYAVSFSVRNDGSKERLQKQLNKSIDEVPDPGFFVWENFDSDRGSSLTEKNKVIIQLANDKPSERFGDSENLIEKAIADVVNKIPEDVLFMPHVFEDIAMYKQILPRLHRKAEIFDFGKNAFDHIHSFLNEYDKAKYVISMRGHSQIIPIARNIPVICLSNHPKHSGLMKKLGMDDFVIDVNNKITGGKILDLIGKINHEKDYLINLEKKLNSEFHKYTDNYFYKLKEKI